MCACASVCVYVSVCVCARAGVCVNAYVNLHVLYKPLFADVCECLCDFACFI